MGVVTNADLAIGAVIYCGCLLAWLKAFPTEDDRDD
jgi:hypothetical protein